MPTLLGDVNCVAERRVSVEYPLRNQTTSTVERFGMTAADLIRRLHEHRQSVSRRPLLLLIRFRILIGWPL